MKKRVAGLIKKDESRLKSTLVFTILVSILVIILVVYVQLTGQNKISHGCSYLDPITIDLLAFFAALFLVIDGFTRIIQNPSTRLRGQLTRITRIAFGCAIVSLHILQFLHK